MAVRMFMTHITGVPQQKSWCENHLSHQLSREFLPVVGRLPQPRRGIIV